jgi:hypothetical protein
MSLKPKLNLAELQEAFARWRETRRPRQIPAALGANAVALLERHGTNEILRTLGIDHRTLMRWKRRYGKAEAAPAFVELPAPTPALEAPVVEGEALALTLTRHAGDGTALSLEGELTPEQWRVAVALLAAAEVAP